MWKGQKRLSRALVLLDKNVDEGKALRDGRRYIGGIIELHR